MEDRFKEYVEKEKNRELLNRAMYAPSMMENWRQIFTILLATTIIVGVFASRTRRFKNVLATIEARFEASALTKSLPKSAPAAPKAVAKIIEDPDHTVENAERAWAKEEKNAPAKADVSEVDDMIADELKSRGELANRMEKIAAGDMSEVLRKPAAPKPPPVKIGQSLANPGAPDQTPVQEGIGNKE